MDKPTRSGVASHWTKKKLGPKFTGTVEALGAKRLIRFKTPAEFEGRRFRFEVAKDGKFEAGSGPFRVEYRLFNPFAVFDDQLTWSEVRENTNIHVSESVAGKKILVYICNK